MIVESFDAASALSRTVAVPVATMAGEVFRGGGLVEGGSRHDARGILETRGEAQRLREQVAQAKSELERMRLEATSLDTAIASSEAAIAVAVAEQHRQEKAAVLFDAQVARASDEFDRASRRLDVVRTEHRRAQEEERAAEQRREESAAAIAVHQDAQKGAADRLDAVIARLHQTREIAETRTRHVTEARTAQAALIERTSNLEIDVVRLDEAARELEARIASRTDETTRNTARREDLRQSIRATEARLDDDVRTLDDLRRDVRVLDERVSALRVDFTAREHEIRGARHAFDAVRAELTHAEVARATAAADLTHLTAACLEAIGLAIDDVVAAVARMEEAGELVAPARRVAAVAAPDEDEEDVPADVVIAATAGERIAEADDDGLDESRPVSPDDVIADLRKKIDRLGPVNMMAIEQFDELETRHTFLTTQRKDLLDSISQTGEAIRKIDKTTRERFAEAFESINRKFETTFTTLFGGGRAGLVLIDIENDPESGIDIIAQPPGKRLQNVQLLSGGEKALTAMALMFAIFQHRPSPFCLLDEIDAPLDDANIGRFVEMLQNMQAHTQFILITHNRKTMEIADRLYGVTMEEPGVSKLISVQLN